MRLQRAGSETITTDPFSFTRADLEKTADIAIFTDLNREYFTWMDGELLRVTGKSLAGIVGMDIESYVQRTVAHARQLAPQQGQLFFLRSQDGAVSAMGGLRLLPDGVPEIVRIYTRPEYRGKGLGAQMVAQLIAETERDGHHVLRLDTAVFMRAAQKIYAAAGFRRRDPYPGAEPPAFLQPYWLYMERSRSDS